MSVDDDGERAPSSPSSPARRRTVGIVVIGNEVLSGKVEELNAAFFIRRLRALGARVREVAIVEDEPEAIGRAVTRLRGEVDDLLTSGGVGPTHDDVTIDAVANAIGVPVVESPAILEKLQTLVRGPLSVGHRRLCKVPEGAALIFGTRVPWPVARVDGGPGEARIWLFPGVPKLLQALFEDVAEHFGGNPDWHLESLELVAEESAICETLDAIVLRFADVAIGSYPRVEDGRWRLKLTFEGADAGRVAAARTEALSRLEAWLPNA